ncbi:hypothetical protein QBA54_14975 [Streptomyces sp. B21-108]|jgi:hypothetical protein|uniref:hypothetical protein n=1 Tax=Streptomyces sp. B21-108 TaxID=3039419 RepID=UPI002FF29E31
MRHPDGSEEEARSAFDLIEGPGQLSVGGPPGLQLLGAIFELALEFHHPLFEGGDLPLEVVDVGGRPEAGVAPGLFTALLGEPVLQLSDAGGEPDVAFQGVRQNSAAARSTTIGTVVPLGRKSEGL